jgi:selenocysteine-specific elongation factor
MKHVIVGTAGHIDHGKSALVRALTGTDPDRLKEEKERGITIDLGFAFLDGPEGLSLGFVDVPGHERFVKNMLAGAGGIDLVMLVVAADESVMPQTKEHFEICRLLKVQRGLIAITKMDLVEPDLRELVAIEVRELVAGSFLKEAPLVLVSSKTGEGVDNLKHSLFDVAAHVEPRSTAGIFRLPIDRVFSMKGFGTVVTGTLISGSIGVDEDVEILPRGIKARVRGLQTHGDAAESALAGQRTAINLQGVDVGDVMRGDTLVRPQTLTSSMMLDGKLEVIETSPIPIKDLTRAHLHLGTAQVVTRIRVLGGKGVITPGNAELVQLRLEAPVVAAPGDRFIIRRYSPLETLGGGFVLDAAPIKHSVTSTEVTGKLDAISGGDPAKAAALFIADSGIRGTTGSALAMRLGVDEQRLTDIVERLVIEERAHRLSTKPLLLVSPDVTDSVCHRLQSIVEDFQRNNPLQEGMPRGELKEKATGGAPNEIFEWALGRLVRDGHLRAERDRVATADHQVHLNPEEESAAGFLLEAYGKARYQPSSIADMAASSKRDPKLLERIERLLIQEGKLVKVAAGMVFHREALEELKASIARQKNKGDLIDVAFFKQLAGVTRKHAIPLLEWLDKERVTRRVGKDRVVL